MQQKVPARSFESLLEDGSVGCSLSQPGDNQGTSPGWCHPCPKPSSLGTAQLRPFFLVAHFPAPHPGVPAGWAGGHRGHRQGVGSPVQCWALPPWDRDTGRSLPMPPGQGIWCPLLLEGWDGDPEPGIPLGAAWGLPGCVRPWHPWAKVWVQISSPGMLPGHSQVGCGGLECPGGGGGCPQLQVCPRAPLGSTTLGFPGFMAYSTPGISPWDLSTP